jgi:tetratricopeptide (TPR) repeat protein
MSSELTQGDWLERRYHPDLDPRAERALRAAGLAWQQESEAERQLRIAHELAPEHRAVAIAHYRYYLYKHRFAEALPHLERCLAMFASALAGQDMAELALTDAPEPRAWMFARQAYGYLLLRLGREAEGIAALEALVALDGRDQTKTRSLLAVVTRPADDEP